MEACRRERCLRFRVVVFSELDYCGQVRACSSARVLIGVHGQGLSNSIFLREEAVVVELTTPKVKVVAGYGNQPLAEALGMRYAEGRLAEGPDEKRCGITNWKIDPTCPSYVNVSKLRASSASASSSVGLVMTHLRRGGWATLWR